MTSTERDVVHYSASALDHETAGRDGASPAAQVYPSGRYRRSRATHCTTWSLTRPQACMAAYAVVGPTKTNPCRLSARASAMDSGDVAGTSASVRGGTRVV